MKTLLFFSFCLLLIPVSAKERQWKETSRDDGIIIYRADVDPATGIVPIRFRATLPFALPRVLAVLDNSERKVEWVPNMIFAKTIERKSLNEKIELATYDAPWPFKNRSILVRAIARYEVENRELFIKASSIEDPRAPLDKEKYVRAHTTTADVYLKGVGPQETLMDMTFLTDFKGFIPAWVINLVQKSWPENVVKNLSKQLKRKDIIIPKEFIKRWTY